MIHACRILGPAIALAIFGGIASSQESNGGARPSLAIWDTGHASSQPLSAEAIEQKTGWKSIARGDAATAFQGDAVITNGRLLAVARKQGAGLEIYSLGSGNPVLRTHLHAAPSSGIDR